MILYIIAIILVILGLVYMFPIALVQGDSMYPYLKHNEVIVLRRVINKKKLKDNKVYAYRKPEDTRIVIKRLFQHNDLVGCYFLGDNPFESYDSRDYGYVKAENIIAVLMWNSKYQLK